MTNVVGGANNHTPLVGPTQYRRCVYVACEGTSIISVANFPSCRQLKKLINEDTIIPQDFQKGGFENK